MGHPRGMIKFKVCGPQWKEPTCGAIMGWMTEPMDPMLAWLKDRNISNLNI